jgi:ABC-2 type transport system permease protein
VGALEEVRGSGSLAAAFHAIASRTGDFPHAPRPTAAGTSPGPKGRPAGPGWAGAAGLLLVTLLELTSYTCGTTTLAARRQQFVLKRLHLSGAADAAILAGILTPIALLTLVQTRVLFGVLALAEGIARVDPLPLLAAVGGEIVAAGVLAIATAAVTPAPELAQLTTAPIALAFAGGGLWVVRVPVADVGWPMLALPGAAVTQLARLAAEPGAGSAAPAIVALTAVSVIVGLVAIRVICWDPRR